MPPNTDDDVHALLILIAAGDRKAFTVLFEKEYKKVNSFAFRLTRSREQAQEIVQDIFLKLWVNRIELGNVKNWGGYLTTIVRNHSFNVLRKMALDTQTAAEVAKLNSDIDTTTETKIEIKSTRELLEEAVSSLPPQQQKVYRLCHLEGLKYAEAAERLNLSPGTVQAHMKQALSNIRKYLVRIAPLIIFSSTLSLHNTANHKVNVQIAARSEKVKT